MPILKIKDENGNWTKVPFVGNDNEIFWVTYGTTTYAEITAALESGKEVLCKYSDKMYQYSWVNSANSAYILTCTYSSTIYWISITPENVYSTSSRQVYGGIGSTSLTEASDSLVYTSLKTQNLINAVDAKVEDAKEAKDQLYLTNQTIFADVDLPLNGYIDATTHEFVESNDYKCSGFVYVKGVSKIYWKARSIGDSYRMCFYDENKTSLPLLDFPVVNSGNEDVIDLTDVAYSDVAYIIMSAYPGGYPPYLRLVGNFDFSRTLTEDNMEVKVGTNLFDYRSVLSGTKLNVDGTISYGYSGSTNHMITDFIKIPEGAIGLYFKNLPVYGTSSSGRYLIWYDSNKEYIAGTTLPDNSATHVMGLREGAVYFRFSVYQNTTLPQTSDPYKNIMLSATDTDFVDFRSYVSELGGVPVSPDFRQEDITNLRAKDDVNPLEHILRETGYGSLIHSWGIIGDSLSSGETIATFNGQTENVDYYEYSWGQRFAKLNGVDCYNFSNGGQTTVGWIVGGNVHKAEDNYKGGVGGGGWTFAKLPENHKQAYIIALGANDSTNFEQYPLGSTATDINTYDPSTDSYNNALTFVGFYAGIIQRLKGIQPDCKIFLINTPAYGRWHNDDINTGIQDIYEYFSDLYPNDIFLLDINKYMKINLSNGDYDLRGHGSAMGYQYFGYVVNTYIDWIIRNNGSKFSNIAQTKPKSKNQDEELDQLRVQDSLYNNTVFTEVDLPLSGYISQATHQFVKTNGDEFKCSGFVYVKGAKTIEFSARSYTTAGDSCQMVFYNSSKTPITSLDICVNDGIARTIDLTDVAYSEVAYVVMSAYIPGWATSTYFRIKGNYNLDSFLTGDDIDHRTGFNLFDKNSVKLSTAVNNQGEEISRNRCVLSGVIVIPEGASSIHFRGLPTWTTSEGGSVRRYAYYDINWNLIGELATTDCDQASAELGVRTNAKYIKFELYRDMGSEYMPANMDALDNVYVTSNYYPNANFPYHKDIIAINGNNIAATRYLPYIGKKWTVIGDSLTARTDYTTKTYFDYIQEETGINVVNLGDGGKGWLTGYDGIDHFDNFAMKVPSIPLDTDVVTVFGSFNDIAELDENDFDAAMGDVDDVGYSTICGAMNEFFDELYSRFPSIRVGVITPTPWKTIAPMWTDSPGYKYVQKLKTICEYHSVPYLDLFSCSGLRPWVEANRLAVYSKDLGTGETDPHGTHPNEEGHAIIASRIREFLKTLI